MPKILSDQVVKFDDLVNYFWPDILKRWFNLNPDGKPIEVV